MNYTKLPLDIFTKFETDIVLYTIINYDGYTNKILVDQTS